MCSLTEEMLAFCWLLQARLYAVLQLSLSAACWIALLERLCVGGADEVGRLVMDMAEFQSASMWPALKSMIRSAMVA